uniref:C-type lectin domain-containing protein n=1 Tax=Oryzias latipes TaxID=8090 RepID=A0A3P9IAH6_ORYLA
KHLVTEDLITSNIGRIGSPYYSSSKTFSLRLHPGCISGSQFPLRQYHYVNISLNWSEAQLKNYKDLAMIENQEENTEAKNAKPSNYVAWIGLYREPWTWSDGSKSSFRDWDPSGINNYAGNQHCGTENSEHVWGGEDCSVKRVFVCHQGEHLKKY